jgi:hypothetical protein
MATWIYQRPVDCCDSTELVVAKRLARLGNEWVIRWGFYYETDREGDFVILGPTGGVLVLEVKGGELRKLSTVGRWEGSARNHPVAQLSAEWRAVIDALRESANGGDVPFVTKALCLPDVDIDPKVPCYREIDRNLIVDRDDLAAFELTWRRLFANRHQAISKRERRTFLDSFAKDISPKAIERFISETDKIMLRHTIAEFHVLDMLRGNRQLMVEGGPGSGKTWLALEQAFRFADEGLQVLFLCYNVALADQMSVLVTKRKLRNGEVIVRSWESLARELLDAAGVGWDNPASQKERDRYFDDVVPSLMRAISHAISSLRLDSTRWWLMKLKIMMPVGPDRNPTLPILVGGRFTGHFFVIKRMREWQYFTTRLKGRSFATGNDSNQAASSNVSHNRSM